MKHKRTEKQKEALNAIVANNYHGIILMSVRSGKTKIAIDSIKKLKPNKVLWVTPEVKLRDVAIPEEFEKFRAKKWLIKTDIVCYSSLNKVTGSYNYVILDEYQSITENNLLTLLDGSLKYDSILAMSGTHPKEFDKKNLCSALRLSVIYKLSTDDAVYDDIVADYKINIATFKLDNKLKYIKHKTSGKLLDEKRRYDQLTWVIESNKFSGKDIKYLVISRMHVLYNSINRKRIVKRLLDENCYNRRGLIFHPTKKDAERYDHYFHSTSTLKHFEAFQRKEINQLHLVNKGGVGYTYRELDFCIIAQANSDRTGLTTQKWGRTLLPREDYVADVYILKCLDTVEEKWVESALENVNKNKINYLW